MEANARIPHSGQSKGLRSRREKLLQHRQHLLERLIRIKAPKAAIEAQQKLIDRIKN